VQRASGPGLVPVELFLQQVQACVQLAALLPAQAVQRRAEGRGGGPAAAGHLLVVSAPPPLPPEAEDVGHAREGSWRTDGGECGASSCKGGGAGARRRAYLTGRCRCCRSGGLRRPRWSRCSSWMCEGSPGEEPAWTPSSPPPVEEERNMKQRLLYNQRSPLVVTTIQ